MDVVKDSLGDLNYSIEKTRKVAQLISKIAFIVMAISVLLATFELSHTSAISGIKTETINKVEKSKGTIDIKDIYLANNELQQLKSQKTNYTLLIISAIMSLTSMVVLIYVSKRIINLKKYVIEQQEKVEFSGSVDELLKNEKELSILFRDNVLVAFMACFFGLCIVIAILTNIRMIDATLHNKIDTYESVKAKYDLVKINKEEK